MVGKKWITICQKSYFKVTLILLENFRKIQLNNFFFLLQFFLCKFTLPSSSFARLVAVTVTEIYFVTHFFFLGCYNLMKFNEI